MSKTFKGVVKVVSAKPWQDLTLYSFQIDGDRTWFRTGEVQPPIEKGQYIQFDAEGQNVAVDSITELKGEAPTTVQQAARAAPANRGGANAKNAYWDEREKRDIATQQVIQYQSSRNSAVAFLDVAVKADCLALPTKKALRYDAMLDYLDELTERFEQAANATRSGRAFTTPTEEKEEEGSANDDEILQ